MTTTDPEAPDHEDDHAAEALPADGGVKRTPDVRTAEVVAQTVEDSGLEDGQEVEQPDAEEDFRSCEVAEHEDQGTEAYPEVREPRRDRDVVAPFVSRDENRDGWHAHDEPGGDVPGDGDEEEEEANPKGAVAKEGGDLARLARRTGELEECRSDRVGELLVFHPLFPKENAQAEVGGEEGAQEQGPPEDRRDPRAPGNRMARREPFVEAAHEFPVGEDAPGGDVLEKELIPAVFRRGEIVGRGDDANEVSGEPLALHAGGYHRHGADGQQLGWRQADSAALEEDVP